MIRRLRRLPTMMRTLHFRISQLRRSMMIRRPRGSSPPSRANSWPSRASSPGSTAGGVSPMPTTKLLITMRSTSPKAAGRRQRRRRRQRVHRQRVSRHRQRVSRHRQQVRRRHRQRVRRHRQRVSRHRQRVSGHRKRVSRLRQRVSRQVLQPFEVYLGCTLRVWKHELGRSQWRHVGKFSCNCASPRTSVGTSSR